MKRTFVAILIVCLLAQAALCQWYDPAAGCVDGRCPRVVGPLPVVAAPRTAQSTIPREQAAAIVRVVNARGPNRALGTGTVVDVDVDRALIITCAHLFREGAGAVQVTFPAGRTFAARLVKIDTSADLAALATTATDAEPVTVARQSPQRGDPLISCGYGADGRLWCNRGRALGYVATSGSHGTETLELSGAARFGDSGGPVFDRNFELAAVLFGTNGRVVDGTFCGRVRQFLQGLSPRFGGRRPAVPPSPSARGPENGTDAPLVDVPPSPVQPPPVPSQDESSRLAKLEGLVAHLHERWQGVSTKIDRLAAALRGLREAIPRQDDASEPSEDPLDAIAEHARPALSARLTAILVSFGLPGGLAAVVAGVAVYFVMRRGKRRLQSKLDQLKGEVIGTGEPDRSSNDATDQTIVRHHNRYVPYELRVLDKAWSRAHAHIGEKYPGAVPYLKMAEGVKDQLLSGEDD